MKNKKQKSEIQSKDKFKLIPNIINDQKNQLKLSHLLRVAGVSKSGYYGYINETESKLVKDKAYGDMLRHKNNQKDGCSKTEQPSHSN